MQIQYHRLDTSSNADVIETRGNGSGDRGDGLEA